MRLVFAGTPAFAVPALAALIEARYDVAAVYTQPDRPAGRGRRLDASPVKQLALDHGLAVRQPASLTDPETQATLAATAPDVMIVVAYGLLLPPAVLAAPRRGCLNVHASLLPRWRGAAPIARAIEAGDTHTGVCLMQMEAALDTGPVFACRTLAVIPTDTAASLGERLAQAGAQLLVETLPAIAAGRARATPQDAGGATYAKKLRKQEADIDWPAPAVQIARRVRAFNPYPVARTRFKGETLQVWGAHVTETSHSAAPGTVLAVDAGGITVATGAGALVLTEMQPAGGRRMPAAAFANGYGVREGVRLGTRD